MNCRSLLKHHSDIKSDEELIKSDIICLQETWLEEGTITDDLQIDNYNLHLNNKGRGKRIAIYFRSNQFKHQYDMEIKKILIRQ